MKYEDTGYFSIRTINSRQIVTVSLNVIEYAKHLFILEIFRKLILVILRIK